MERPRAAASITATYAGVIRRSRFETYDLIDDEFSKLIVTRNPLTTKKACTAKEADMYKDQASELARESTPM
jgi:hypothetical protein